MCCLPALLPRRLGPPICPELHWAGCSATCPRLRQAAAAAAAPATAPRVPRARSCCTRTRPAALHCPHPPVRMPSVHAQQANPRAARCPRRCRRRRDGCCAEVVGGGGPAAGRRRPGLLPAGHVPAGVLHRRCDPWSVWGCNGENVACVACAAWAAGAAPLPAAVWMARWHPACPHAPPAFRPCRRHPCSRGQLAGVVRGEQRRQAAAAAAPTGRRRRAPAALPAAVLHGTAAAWA